MTRQEYQDRSLNLQLEIDKACREFERHWQAGETPRLEEHIAKFPGDGRLLLLKELLLIEQHYRTDIEGLKLNIDQICALHPDLSADFPLVIDAFPTESHAVTTSFNRSPQPSLSIETLVPAQARGRRRGSSRGLHVRCPHCSNPVELLCDASIDSVVCQTCGSVFSLVNKDEATQQAPILEQIGRFEIVGRLGVGGFGTVWKARDPELERAVAIKIPRRGQLDSKGIEAFLKEARTAAQLHHPNIVPVYEVGKDGDTVFIVSELVRGVSLSDWLSGASPSYRQIAEMLIRVAEALEHAHQKGVIHRDLKPSNIMIDEADQPIVMDFGLAKRDGLEIAMTVDGQVLGTPAYMSPEQASGHSNWTDRRMDIYSFGVVLFRMLTGELPFRGNAHMQIHQRLTQDAPDPRTLNRFIPQDLATICLKCMERDPNNRYSSAKQLAEELKRFIRGEPIVARPISRIERTIRWAKRKPALAAAATLLVVVAVGGVTAALVIEGLRQRQGELLVEKNNLIARMGQERAALVDEKNVLQEELDVWQGKANPWKIWPPKPTDRPQRSLLESLIPAGNSLAENWQRDPDPVRQVFGHLALAMMYDELSMPELAVPQYSQAHDKLRDICANEPNAGQFTMALADCCANLARLTVDHDRDQAAEYLKEAEQAWEAIGGAQLAPSRAELINTKLDLAILPGFPGAAESLRSAEEIRNSFARIVPTDARRFYQLICQLTNRTPHLALSDPRTKDSAVASPDAELEVKDGQ